jgi:flagellar biosynthesis GTPase FlhF
MSQGPESRELNSQEGERSEEHRSQRSAAASSEKRKEKRKSKDSAQRKPPETSSRVKEAPAETSEPSTPEQQQIADAEKMAEDAVQSLPAGQQAAVKSLFTSTSQLSTVAANDTQGLAAAAANILNSYYTIGLQQSKLSFRAALAAAITGAVFFLIAVAFLLRTQSLEIATVSTIGGALVELISGLLFYLYGRTTAQLADHRRSLEQTQRFLLANSITDDLKNDAQPGTQDKARASLVSTISQWSTTSGRQESDKTPKTP